MQRYFIEMAYDGTNYHGWQVQENAVTLQAVLNEKFSLRLNEEIVVTGAGRTDTGVHAGYYVAHFDSYHHDLDENSSFIQSINRFLPPDISLFSISKVNNTSHARFDAKSRTYNYYISTRKDIFFNRYSYYRNFNYNIEKMNEAASILLDHEDFTSFSKLHTNTRTNLCKVFSAGWMKSGYNLIFEIKANRFLRDMARAIVGTLLEIGMNKKSTDDFREIILQKDRSAAGGSIPAKGLFLTNIEYPVEIFKPGVYYNKMSRKFKFI